ncbi:cyclic nucleotide-binding domain-containing protein [Crocosphaera sp. UHCC 0190]|uniref:cyclic nucleotide-binding domain-containing protein n=1 Tax=Crocosphaera sp. UHCC 0190 TaxID=3110246 RepID=UPI002B1F1AFF|nr:cyclic nucleotide-binding domain-containing protein [Crocosphaera sp. UHCC 0190]MEA5509383.1 cyclic nucleotide-binding domain-containing protein [Crocosphaera sp. UHCC 0190]
MSAFLQGMLGASSLAIGASVGVYLKPSRTLSAAIMAFGSGTLIAAIAFEIARKVYEETGFLPLTIGFAIGGVLFTTLSQYIDEHGGFLRNPASSRRYLLEQQQEQAEEPSVLQRLSQVEVIQQLPETEKEAIANLVTPIHIKPGQVICQEGEPGDYFYMIAQGEAEVIKGKKILTVLGPGEIFGEMSLLTGESRSATVISRTPMELYQLNQENFGQVLTRSPHLALALSRTLARRLRHSVDSHIAAQENLDRWREQLMEQVELDRLLREDTNTLQGLVKRSAPLAILVGTLLDNIPEATVIGMNSGAQHLGWSFLLAVFISNFPEALSSAAGMKQAGTPKSQILLLWFGVVLLSGIIAMGGYYLQDNTSLLVIGTAQAIAGGAILAMLASTMMPEAYELGGSSVSYSTIAGFLLGFLIAMISK